MNKGHLANGHDYKGMIDLYRIVAILLIMKHHLYIEGGRFGSAWIYVEFFFILTGCLTAKKFVEASNDLGGVRIISYTFHKFWRLMPYIVISVLTEYIVDIFLQTGYAGKRQLLTTIENMICEILLLSSSGSVSARVAPIWFVSAMILVFPIFLIVLVKIKNNKSLLWTMSACIPTFYYGWTGIVSRPADLPRAFSCLWLGVFTYLIIKEIKRINKFRGKEVLLTLTEVGAFAFTVLMCFYNTGNNKLIVMMFMITIALCMSAETYTRYINFSLCRWLGKISMVLYLFHWPVKSVLLFAGFDLESLKGIVSYYFVSIAVSSLCLLCVEQVKKHNYKIKKGHRAVV